MVRDLSLSQSLSVKLGPMEAREMSPLSLHRVSIDSAAVGGNANGYHAGSMSSVGGREIIRPFTASDGPGLKAPGAISSHDFGGAPSLSDEVSFLNGIDGEGNVVATSYWTWARDNPATFNDHSNVAKWGANHATTDEVVTINYFFHPNAHWNNVEQGVFESCMALWSAITNVNFVEVTDSDDAMLTLKRNHSGSAFSSTKVESGNHAGDIGQDKLSVKTSNLISIDTSVPGFGPIDGDFTAFGGYVFGTLVHELGHSLGLGHAGAYNGFVTPTTQQFSPYDVLMWSVMSYINPEENAKYDDEYPIDADWNGNTATTWMPLDILGVQGLYGTPLDTPLDGGQTFGFNCDVTGKIKHFFDFTENVNPVVTIWSAGEDNTLDLSGFNQDSTIDLHPGTFTSCDGMVGNIAIAFGTVIENAVGGKGDDRFLGTDLGNTLVGNKGNDTFGGGLGADRMDGGKGHDTYVYDVAGESTSVSFDTVTKFDFEDDDHFQLSTAVAGVDSTVDEGALSEASFDTDLAAAIGSGELGAGNAVLFTADSGDFAGDTFLVIDRGGGAGYQAGSDLVIFLDGARHLGEVDGADFVI